MPRRLARMAITPIFVLTALLAPASASAYTVTVHVHGAGAVTETTARHLVNCTMAPDGRSKGSVTDCVGGTASGLFAFGDIIRLEASVPADAYARGWRFSKWVDGNAAKQINCDPQPTTGDHFDVGCQFQIFDNLYADLYFNDVQGPLDTSLSGGPSGTVKQTSASFGFDAPSDPDTTFQCKLDRPGSPGGFAICGGPADKSESYGALTTNGVYTFSVRGVDPSGNVGNTAARSWTVDTVAPAPSLTGGPAEGVRVSSTSASFTVATNEGTLVCALDGVSAACPAGPRAYSGLAQGPHTFTLTATDTAGNSSSISRHWTVDTMGPVVTFGSGPAAASNTRSATIAFSANEPAAFQCSLDGAAFVTCQSPVTYSGLAEGAHTFRVFATDGLSNVGTTAARSWIVDTQAPDTTFLGGPAAGSTSPTSSATFSFASPDSSARFECRLDGAAFTPCTSPRTLTGVPNGDHTFAVRAVDAAGNRDATPSTRTWRVNSLDDDADGYNRPQDCNDANPAIHPGASDTPEDGIDQDCNRVDARWQMPNASISWLFGFAGARAKVTTLVVKHVPAGGRVEIRCAGGKAKGCRFARRSVQIRKGMAKPAKLLKRFRLKPRAVLEIRVSAPGLAAKVARFTVRARPRTPKVKTGCIKPGTSRLTTCG